MISSAHRFHGHGSLRYVYQHGRTIRTPLFSLAYSENAKRETYRAAVVVSKKVNKSAVARNRLRRRLFEAIRLLEPSFTGAFDLVFTIHNESVATIAVTELHEAVQKALQSAGVTKAWDVFPGGSLISGWKCAIVSCNKELNSPYVYDFICEAHF